MNFRGIRFAVIIEVAALGILMLVFTGFRLINGRIVRQEAVHGAALAFADLVNPEISGIEALIRKDQIDKALAPAGLKAADVPGLRDYDLNGYVAKAVERDRLRRLK